MIRPSPGRSARALRAAAAVGLAAAVLAGCGSSTGSSAGGPPAAPRQDAATTPAPTPPTSSGPTTSGSPGVGAPSGVAVPAALQFEATTVSGDPFEGASVAGRPVVLWFWAPWCSVCKSQVPEVSDLAATYGDDVAFLGVGALSDADAIKAFADDAPGPKHLSDPDGKLYQRFGIAEQSSFVVLDAQGHEVLRTGYADDGQLAATVAGLAR